MELPRVAARLRALTHKVVELPEFSIVLFSLLLHFVWEMLQVPFYSALPDNDHWDGIIACGRATIGDSAIALLAFWSAAWAGGTRRWFLSPNRVSWVAYLAVGLLCTVVLELLATQLLNRWSYAPTMPVLPVVPIGALPLLQWLFVPQVVLWITYRQLRVHATP